MLKKKITKRIIFIFGIFLGLSAAFSLGAYAESMQSSSVYYDNTTSGGSSNTVSGALDELYEKANSCSSSGPEEDTGTFAGDSWSVIARNVKSGNHPYKVGDKKIILLKEHTNGCYSSSGSGSSYICTSKTEEYKAITLRVANTSACTNGETSETACGFVVEFAEISELHNMNPANSSYAYGYNVGGWPASAMRAYINNKIYNALPSDLKNVIANTKVVSSYGKNDSANFTSTDKLYLLSPKEIYSNWSSSEDTAEDTTRQLEYYKNQGVTTSSYSAAIKQYNGLGNAWWLRSASSYNNYRFSYVYTAGRIDSTEAHLTIGVAPAFRIA